MKISPPSPDWLIDSWTCLQFELRKKVWGRIKLRRGLPSLKESPAVQVERAYYELLLRRLPSELVSEVTGVVDVGCRNGSYLEAFFRVLAPSLELMGFELDGYRRYWNGYRRWDFLLAYAEQLRSRGHRVLLYHQDFCDWKGEGPLERQGVPQKILFTFFYPFVSSYPCQQWGLPRRFSQFSNWINQVEACLQQQGVEKVWILSAHQGPWEAEIARELYEKSPVLKIIQAEELSAEEVKELWPSPFPTTVFLLGGNHGQCPSHGRV